VAEFKPEFAGKINFYLSAVDDLLRHRDDRPSIGIILCKGRNRIVVEYALRDAGKPMGVAQYHVSPALPEKLVKDLPTIEELTDEFLEASPSKTSETIGANPTPCLCVRDSWPAHLTTTVPVSTKRPTSSSTVKAVSVQIR
jgi:hypothetical protein